MIYPLDYGQVKWFCEKGYGFVSSCTHYTDVFFHIAKLDNPTVREELQRGPFKKERGIWFWYTPQLGKKGTEASRIWTILAQIPTDICIDLVGNTIPLLKEQGGYWRGTAYEYASQLFARPDLPRSLLSGLIETDLFQLHPAQLAPLLNDEQREQFKQALDLPSRWRNLGRLIYSDDHELTRMLYGEEVYQALRQEREVAEEQQAALNVRREAFRRARHRFERINPTEGDKRRRTVREANLEGTGITYQHDSWGRTLFRRTDSSTQFGYPKWLSHNEVQEIVEQARIEKERAFSKCRKCSSVIDVPSSEYTPPVRTCEGCGSSWYTGWCWYCTMLVDSQDKHTETCGMCRLPCCPACQACHNGCLPEE